ncbi:MAG TPA: 2-C-methyl-D-erythritol 4-phosphate cytidylyltransferase, partial [Longimicrobiales bacterium]
MNVGAIIAAAGSGRRMGGVRKAFLEIAGRPMLQFSVETFLSHPQVSQVVVALAAEDLADPPGWLCDSRIKLVNGGAERADSVQVGLAALGRDVDAVIVHDAARPLVTAALIDRVLAEVRAGRSATVAIAVTDTLHEVDSMHDIRATPDRRRFWRAQTPQAFPRDVLEHAFARSPRASEATDEAGLVAAAGSPVRIVPGEVWNIKVT